jgi:hypothetical protein
MLQTVYTLILVAAFLALAAGAAVAAYRLLR